MKSTTLILSLIIAITCLEIALSQSILFRLKNKKQTESKFDSGRSGNEAIRSTKDASNSGKQYFRDSYFLPII